MKLSIKFFTNLLFAIMLPLSIVQAQDTITTDPLQSGSKALQFQISDNFNLNSFSGTTFSYKWHLSDVRAKRIGFSFNNRYTWRSFPDSDNEEISSLDLNFGIDYTWMNYTNPDSDIKFFYGYGPGVDFGFDKSVQEENGVKRTSQASFYGIAGIGYAGVEWFFQSSMSLHAEYRATVQINHRHEKNITELNGNEEVNKINSTSISLGGNGVRFGLSVYF
ncbi:MAG TPA: hypothetical protein VF181_02200 [Balneolaceae bacterium]